MVFKITISAQVFQKMSYDTIIQTKFVKKCCKVLDIDIFLYKITGELK